MRPATTNGFMSIVERAKRDMPGGKIKSVEPVDGGVRITSENTVEVEGAARPALVAETISMQFD